MFGQTLLEQLGEGFVLVTQVNGLLIHLPLQQQVADVPLLQKPQEELLKSLLHPHFLPVLSDDQGRNVTRSRYPLDLTQIERLGCWVTALVLLAQLRHSLGIDGTSELSEDFLGDVAAYVLLVVALTANSLFLLLFLENFERFGLGELLL